MLRFLNSPEATDFRRRSLSKGLLKPFKGKEQLPMFASECEAVRDALMQRSQRLLAQAIALECPHWQT
jgi:hypothetical protein